MVCFNAAFGGGCLRQQALEHAPGYPQDAAVFADFNAEFDSLPLGIPSASSGKVKNIGAFGRASKPTMFSICSRKALQQ
jgi:hypothetical protein